MPAKMQDGRLMLVDQRHLPFDFGYFDATEFDQLIYAIQEMVVRGAPAIGFVAAYGLALSAEQLRSGLNARLILSGSLWAAVKAGCSQTDSC